MKQKLGKIRYIPERKPFESIRRDEAFYQGKVWRKLRNYYIKMNPLCVQCAKEGKYIGGSVVDHIKPINPVNAYDMQDGKYGHPTRQDNLQTLCTRHHNQKSGRS